MEFERVINGIVKYINAEVYKAMNDWQEIIARIAVARMANNTEQLKNSLMNNSFLRSFAICDGSGKVDVEGLTRDLRTQIAQKGKVTIELPLMPILTFHAEDVDVLKRYIMES